MCACVCVRGKRDKQNLGVHKGDTYICRIVSMLASCFVLE